MKILLITPFKVGSTTLSYILQKKYSYTGIWEIDTNCIEIYNKNENFLLRGHNRLNYELMNTKHFDIWFTIVRVPTDIYISGFFQDIDCMNYPYYFGTKHHILRTPNETLLEYFLQYEWNTFNQFSYDFNFNEIYKYTNINIWEENFDKEKGYSIYNNLQLGIKVCVLTIESLININNILSELNITNTKFDQNMHISQNTSKQKWYKNKYIGVKNILPKCYFDKYKKEDDKILNKFYKKVDILT